MSRVFVVRQLLLLTLIPLTLVPGDPAYAQLATPGGRTIGGGTFAVTCGGFSDVPFQWISAGEGRPRSEQSCVTLNNPPGSACSVDVLLANSEATPPNIAVRPNQTVTLCAPGVASVITTTGSGSGTVVLTWRVDRADDAGK